MTYTITMAKSELVNYYTYYYTLPKVYVCVIHIQRDGGAFMMIRSHDSGRGHVCLRHASSYSERRWSIYGDKVTRQWKGSRDKGMGVR